MSTFKKVLASFVISVMSSTSFAVANPSYEEVKAAIDNTLANNVLDVKRNQASNVLKQVRAALQKNELQTAKESLTDALNRYKEIKQLYASNH